MTVLSSVDRDDLDDALGYCVSIWRCPKCNEWTIVHEPDGSGLMIACDCDPLGAIGALVQATDIAVQADLDQDRAAREAATPPWKRALVDALGRLLNLVDPIGPR